MFDPTALFSKRTDRILKDRVARLLRTDPAKLRQFEDAYRKMALSPDAEPTGNLFDVGKDQARPIDAGADDCPKELTDRIVAELLAKTEILSVGTGFETEKTSFPALPDGTPMVKNADLAGIAPGARPQLTGNLMKVDIDGMSGITVLSQLQAMQKAKSPSVRADAYHRFRQGLDILDMDPILYAILDRNPNTISHWLPGIAAAAKTTGFFKIPSTKIAKVPMPMLQLARLDYGTLSPATMKIVDEWAFKAFSLDVSKDYFVKTGIFSSKFDFRNAHVTGAKEVRELGEYLLFIHNQATLMAGPLAQPSIYGAATTNEWAVREFIPDTENNPCIYKGLPLRTEYRVFVDFDTGEILGVNPYWDPDVMKNRFAEQDDAASPHQRHDYVIYKMHEPVLMGRYRDNVDAVTAGIAKILPYAGLAGQWSIDVMQNGSDFYIIDMATAATSALNSCVPKDKLKPFPENWIPRLQDIGGEVNVT